MTTILELNKPLRSAAGPNAFYKSISITKTPEGFSIKTEAIVDEKPIQTVNLTALGASVLIREAEGVKRYISDNPPSSAVSGRKGRKH